MPVTEREVAYDDLARGYEVEPGRFVTLERSEIEAARPARSTTIAIEEFVDLEQIDPVYFDKSYYIAPTREGERPYVLLLRAMERAALVGVGRFVLRSKPHLVAIRPMERALGLETLYFSDEVRPAQDIVRGLDAIEAPARELALAEQLITMLRNDWDPAKYADDYREELWRIIAERTPVALEEPAGLQRSAPRVSELMDALRASIDAAKEGQPPPRRKRRAG
jgi:DNA end-binding protein Ku